jgi:hypothetical protein
MERQPLSCLFQLLGDKLCGKQAYPDQQIRTDPTGRYIHYECSEGHKFHLPVQTGKDLQKLESTPCNCS